MMVCLVFSDPTALQQKRMEILFLLFSLPWQYWPIKHNLLPGWTLKKPASSAFNMSHGSYPAIRERQRVCHPVTHNRPVCLLAFPANTLVHSAMSTFEPMRPSAKSMKILSSKGGHNVVCFLTENFSIDVDAYCRDFFEPH